MTRWRADAILVPVPAGNSGVLREGALVDRLKIFRSILGYSQAQMACRLGMSRRRLSESERSERALTPEERHRLAELVRAEAPDTLREVAAAMRDLE